ncbi:MAG: D-glucuronyl C5-epimerase family protein [Dehalococcoidia bacterium]
MVTSVAGRIDYYRRAFLAYGLGVRSQLSFWHEPSEINQAAFSSGASGYYMTFRQKARYAGPFDAQGVPLLNYRGRLGVQYNPIAVAQYGLAHYNVYLETGQTLHRQACLWQADWLVANLEQNAQGVPVWRHHFDWHYRDGLKAPWASGLAQGQGVSLLLRAHLLTGDGSYAEAAGRAFQALRREMSQGGVAYRDGHGGLWFEEYLVAPPSHILNGFIAAAWGVHDYARFRQDAEAEALFRAATETLLDNLPRYDAGYWSCYELRDGGMPMLASPFYHALHITQLEAMGRLTGRGQFTAWARRWRSYQKSPLNRARALAHKALFKLRYY